MPIQDAVAQSAEPVSRWSVRAHGSSNIFSNYLGASLGYRTPVLGNRLEPFVTLIPGFGLVGPLTLGFGMVGTRLYWWDSPGAFQPFAQVAAGVSMSGSSGSASSTINGPYQVDFPIVTGGIGADYMFTRHIGLSGMLGASTPFLIWPELSLKVAF